MNQKYVFGFFVLATLSQVATSKWCNLESCRGAEHIDCKMFKGDFAKDCPANATVVNLQKFRNFIVDEINSYRNKIAGGEMKGFQPAVRMATMRYNNTLANLARRNAMKCKVEHDACRNTPDFERVGQNIASLTVPDNITLSMQTVISEIFEAWWGQSSEAKQSDIDHLNSDDDNSDIAHFTQMVTMYSSRVGCGCVLYTVNELVTVHFVCNFDLGNVLDWPVYQKGEAASECESGTNPDYPNLCSFYEKYNVNYINNF